MKPGNALTYSSIYGTRCNTCGSLVEACGNVVKCREEAAFHIDEAIRRGTSDHPLLETATRLLGKAIFALREEQHSRERKSTVSFKPVKG